MTAARVWYGIGVLLLATQLVLRAPLVLERLYDPDEFEHAHVSLEIAKGKLVYRDFFEHHGPLPYFLAAVFPATLGNRPELLVWNRVPSFAFTLLTLWFVFRLGVRLRGKETGLLACLWLESMPWFVEKSIEWRPDVPAMFFLTLAAVKLLEPRFGRRDGFIAGLLFGCAALCTLKGITIAFWLSVGFCVQQISQKRPWIAELGIGMVGGLLAWVPFLAWFAWNNAASVFLDCVIFLPLKWEAREPFRDVFRSFPNWAPGHVALALVGLGYCWIRHWRPAAWAHGPTTLAFTATAHFAMLPWAPSTFLQYYLLVLPMVAVVVACALTDLVAALDDQRTAFVSSLKFFAAIAVVLGILLLIAGQGGWRPSSAFANLPRLVELSRYTNQRQFLIWYSAVDCLLALTALAGAAFAVLFGRRCVYLAALALMVPGSTRIVNQHFLWKNDQQLADIAQVRKIVGSDGVILDGFTGQGWQNPHALYWWWINPHTEWLMRKRGDMATLRKAIDEGQPDMVIFDKVWNNDGRMVTVYDTVIPVIEKRYRPTHFQPEAFWCMLFLRRDLPDPTAPVSN